MRRRVLIEVPRRTCMGSRVLSMMSVLCVLFVCEGAFAASPSSRTSSAAVGADDRTSVDGSEDDAVDRESDRDEEPGGPKKRRPREQGPKYRHERGSVAVSLFLGVSHDDRGTRFAGGLGLGYAVITGVVPGVRGMIATTDGQIGGEVAMTMTLTPPISLTAIPFAVGEVGRRYEPFGDAWMYGAGVGLYLGHPAELGSALQIGWMWRHIDWSGTLGSQDVQGPIIGFIWDH